MERVGPVLEDLVRVGWPLMQVRIAIRSLFINIGSNVPDTGEQVFTFWNNYSQSDVGTNRPERHQEYIGQFLEIAQNLREQIGEFNEPRTEQEIMIRRIRNVCISVQIGNYDQYYNEVTNNLFRCLHGSNMRLPLLPLLQNMESHCRWFVPAIRAIVNHENFQTPNTNTDIFQILRNAERTCQIE
jgi:hypothetical protein